MSADNALVRLIAALKTAKVSRFGSGSDGEFHDNRVPASLMDGANIVTSEREGTEMHAVLLDIDVPAWLVPSSTPGHSHLYIDAHIKTDDYLELVALLGKVGVLEAGYASAAARHRATSLRLPWVKKDGAPTPAASPDPWSQS